jgi:hypothetical protein
MMLYQVLRRIGIAWLLGAALASPIADDPSVEKRQSSNDRLVFCHFMVRGLRFLNVA